MPNNGFSQSEDGLTLGLLKAVANDKALTQRSAAVKLGVALGLVNTYLRRCVKKGFIKVRHAPANRYAYYLTPRGLIEKGRLSAEFLTQSLSLFRQAQRDYTKIFEYCEASGWQRIIFHGISDLTEIALLYSHGHDLKIRGIVEQNAKNNRYGDLPVETSVEPFGKIDAHVITDLHNPQPIFDDLLKIAPPGQILAPGLLELTRPNATKDEAVK